MPGGTIIVRAVIVMLLTLMPWAARAQLPPALGEISGQVVWVDFWASWCAPCRRSFPWMNRMHARYAKQGLQIIAVNVDKERAAADQFLKETPAAFALKFDPEGNLAETFGVEAMPTSYLIDGSSGEVIERHLGFKLGNADHYEAAIKAALAAHGTASGAAH